MRFPLGMLGCVLAGCVAQPTTSNPCPSAISERTHDSQPAQGSLLGLAPAGSILRIGIEHLPPDERMAHASDVRVESLTVGGDTPLRGQEPRRRTSADVDAARTHVLTDIDLAAIDDPFAREALHFMIDLVQTDQRRVRRTGGNPLLDFYLPDQERGPLLVGEQLLLADQEEWLQEHGPALLQRPMRQLLRRLPLVQQLEFDFRDFRTDNLPLSGPTRQANEPRNGGMRVSVRVHLDDLGDPLEVMFSDNGMRIGTSQEIGKLGYQIALSDELLLELRARTEYASGDHAVRVDLSYRPGFFTSYHLSVGDDMDFLSMSPLYSLLESPIDGAPGLVLYVVTVF